MLKLKRVGRKKALTLGQPKYFKKDGCVFNSNHIWFYTDTDLCCGCFQSRVRGLSHKEKDSELLAEIRFFGVVYQKRPLIDGKLIDFKYMKPFKEIRDV